MRFSFFRKHEQILHIFENDEKLFATEREIKREVFLTTQISKLKFRVNCVKLAMVRGKTENLFANVLFLGEEKKIVVITRILKTQPTSLCMRSAKVNT